jgi:hypothetical protein
LHRKDWLKDHTPAKDHKAKRPADYCPHFQNPKNKMGSKDHDKVSAEDIQLFDSLLVDYYAKPYLESYHILRNRIEGRFRAKNTNIKYVSLLMADLEDLTLTVVFRLMYISGKLFRAKAERINDLELMANRITDFVYQEELKAIRSRLKEQPIDHSESEPTTPPISQPIGDRIQMIKSEIARDCFEACLERLPASIKDVFRSYYTDESLSPRDLVAMRKRLANEVAGLTPAQAKAQTPEQQFRTLNNLQSKVNKWRKSDIDQCVRDCAEAKESQHPSLNYLSEQSPGVIY